jgi:serine/threonine protein kinase
VALKVPQANLHDDKFWAATTREYQTLSHPPLVKHKNIVKLLGLTWSKRKGRGQKESVIPTLFLEWAELGTLKSFQRSGNGLRYKEKLKIVMDVSEGLRALHNSGIVHCDIKPENILIFPHENGRFLAKITDFDACIFTSEVDGTASLQDGTKTYSAPESSRSILVDDLPKVDIYSFGILVWQVFLDGRSFIELMGPVLEGGTLSVDTLKSTDILTWPINL